MKAAEDLVGDSSAFNDWEEEDEEMPVQSLFCDAIFPSMSLLITHDKEVYNFDLKDFAATLGNDDISLIKMINLIRRRVKDTAAIHAGFVDQVKEEIRAREFLKDDIFMRPVLVDDPVLFLLREALVKSGAIEDNDDDVEEEMKLSAALQRELLSQKDSGEVNETLIKYQSMVASINAGLDMELGIVDDDYYFSGYSHISIHETMLRDVPRTSLYAEALLANSDFMKGKVVLDVGCGTGILSMLAVRAGAKKVIGVDMSSILDRTQKVIDRNGMAEKITLVRGRLEDITLPLDEDEDIDIIVSEWMGYGLYFENMLTSVLHARDNYLAEDGIMMPSDAQIFIEAMTSHGDADRERDRLFL